MENKSLPNPLDKLIATGKHAQRIQYPCGCELIGEAPLPKTCPTHGVVPDGDEILVAVVLDESGSMSSCREQTIAGYNEYLHGLRADGNHYLMTLSKFDAHPGDPTCRVVYANKAVREAPELTSETYVPRGLTPLYDAIGTTIKAIEAAARDRAVLILIVTDGQENASHEFTKASVRDLIKSKESSGNWTFVYLGANQDAWEVGQQFGMSRGNVQTYSTRNIRPMMANLARASQVHARAASSARLAGQPMATSAFFKNAGISKIDADPIASNLGQRGGRTRMNSLPPQERKNLARRAAESRWAKEY